MRAYGVCQSIVPPVSGAQVSPTFGSKNLKKSASVIPCGVVLLPFSFSSTGCGANRKPATGCPVNCTCSS